MIRIYEIRYEAVLHIDAVAHIRNPHILQFFLT